LVGGNLSIFTPFSLLCPIDIAPACNLLRSGMTTNYFHLPAFCRFWLPFLVAASGCRFWLPFCASLAVIVWLISGGVAAMKCKQCGGEMELSEVLSARQFIRECADCGCVVVCKPAPGGYAVLHVIYEGILPVDAVIGG
jgi:hypothetical protein